MLNKIFIEDGLSLYNKTGIGQYTINLANILEGMGYKVVMPRKIFLEKIKNPSLKRILYVLWLNLIFPLVLLFSDCEKVIFTNYLTPIYKIPTKKYYPVIHDLWVIKYPETMSKTKKDYQAWILQVIKRTYHKIITVSNTVKEEIKNHYNCSDDDIKVVYNYFSFGEKPQIDFNEQEQEKLLDKFNLKTKQYILSVGSLNKRKNIQMLIDAFSQIETDKKLVIVGKSENAELSKNSSNIVFTGYLADEELKVLYKNALLFIFPSIYEGFGIPLIDAQSFGVPVICSNIPVFKEIGGDSVLFVQNNIESYVSIITSYLNAPQINIIELGHKNILLYCKDRIKEQLIDIWGDIGIDE